MVISVKRRWIGIKTAVRYFNNDDPVVALVTTKRY
jgi:hypothetical protein